jgi:hypothetical protein
VLRFIVTGIAVLFLSACGGSGGGDGMPNNGPLPKPGPKAPGPVEWGDLPCQKEHRCQNSVLNESFADLQTFLQSQFQKPISEADPEFNLFECGKHAEKAWFSNFTEHAGGRDDQWLEIGRFLMTVTNRQDCTAKTDIDAALNIYFQQTEEYKNGVE